eukprot:4853503-Amphidinium_carterae.2
MRNATVAIQGFYTMRDTERRREPDPWGAVVVHSRFCAENGRGIAQMWWCWAHVAPHLSFRS